MTNNRLRNIAYFCSMRSLFFLLLLLPCLLKAQVNNLVPNPSFEVFSDCPVHSAQIENAVPWFSPLTPLITSEYFNSCCTIPANSGGVSVPDNGFAYQFARTGNAYAGIGVYETGIYREYIEVELNQVLIENKKYCVEFYYSLSEYIPVFIDSIGVCFSNDSALSSSAIALSVIPQVYLPVIIDSLNWVRFFSSFTATGGEKFITIGNFKPNQTQQGLNYSFIDDVSVYLCDDTIPKPIELKIPNVFTPDNDGANDKFYIDSLSENSHLVIYNRWGQSVLDEKNYNNDWDAHEVSAGVYYYILMLPNNERRVGFVEVIK